MSFCFNCGIRSYIAVVTHIAKKRNNLQRLRRSSFLLLTTHNKQHLATNYPLESAAEHLQNLPLIALNIYPRPST